MTLPAPKTIRVNTRGAKILNEESPETRDSRGIYLPNHIEPISYIAVDIGGSLAKVVYFSRSPDPPSPPSSATTKGNGACGDSQSGFSTPSPPSPGSGHHPRTPSGSLPNPKLNGALTPLVLDHPTSISPLSEEERAAFRLRLRRRASLQNVPGGSLTFERFETDNIGACVDFIRALIERSAEVNGVSVEEMRSGVTVVATGGGAHKFGDLFADALGVRVRREDEMECLIEGLKFITLIPAEVYYFSDQALSDMRAGSTVGPANVNANGTNGKQALERPSPDPPKYAIAFEENPTWQLPCLLVNIGSGVSIIKVDEDGQFERVSGTSLGGGTLWGLLSMLTPAESFDEMLTLSERGDNSAVDMLVGDIYGQDYGKLGLKSSTIASTFGKVFKKGSEKRTFSPEDISRSLLYAVSNNIGQIAYMNAEKYDLERIYFGGCFIRGHAATVGTLSYAIRFWSGGRKRALFLRHEGFLGSVGAWMKNIESQEERG